MKGEKSNENKWKTFDICSKMHFFVFLYLILDFEKLHKVFLCRFLIFGFRIEKSCKKVI